MNLPCLLQRPPESPSYPTIRLPSPQTELRRNTSLFIARNFTSEILTKTSHLSDFNHKSIQEKYVRPQVHKAKSPNKNFLRCLLGSMSPPFEIIPTDLLSSNFLVHTLNIVLVVLVACTDLERTELPINTACILAQLDHVANFKAFVFE